MSSDNQGDNQGGGQGSSFWTSMNGVVTAVAGLLTALAGLLVALYQVGVLGDDDSDPTQPAAAVSTEAVDGGSGSPGELLAGTWQGVATGPSAGTYEVELTIEPTCAMRQACGTISVAVGCEGRVRLWNVEGSTYEFYVDRFTDDSEDFCTPGAGDFFELAGDQLLFHTDYDDATGTLERS